MNGQALAELLRRELFNEDEGDAERRAYCRGWNASHRSLYALVAVVEPGILDLQVKDALVKGER